MKWVRDVACVAGKLHAQFKREKLRLSRIKNRIAYLSEEMVRKRPLNTKIQQTHESQEDLDSESEKPRRQKDMGKITGNNPSVD